MILFSPLLILIFLCMFKPVRMIIGWLLFAALCVVVYGCQQAQL